MNFKLPIYHIGISESSQGSKKIAILQRTLKGWAVSQCQTVTSLADLRLARRAYVTASFSLKGSLILTKSFLSSLRKKKNILNTVLCDLDNVSAFSRETLAIAPLISPKTPQEETPVTLWMTQKQSIEAALLSEISIALLPSTITCLTSDLFFALNKTSLKTLPYYFFIFSSTDATACLFVKDGAVLLSRSIPRLTIDAIEDTFRHAQEITPALNLSEIYATNLEETFAEQLANHLKVTVLQHSLHSFLPQHYEYQEAILAAYHGISKHRISFPYDFLSLSQIRLRWIKKYMRVIGMYACISTLFVGAFSFLKLSILQKQVKDNYAIVFPQKCLPHNLHSYQQALEEHKTQIPQYYSVRPTILSGPECLHILNSLSASLPTIRINSFKYSLDQSPSPTAPQLAYKASIVTSGEGSPTEIQCLTDKLSRHPHLQEVVVESESESLFTISWTLCERSS